MKEMKVNSNFKMGIDNYIDRLKKCAKIYNDVIKIIPNDYNESIYKIDNRIMFNKIIANFVTALNPKEAPEDLMNVYDIAIHIKTQALIIANKGATLYSLTEKYEVPHLVRHLGMCIYMPKIGMEYANVGLVGNVYDKGIILRTESACTPSFLFGSQRCNCYYQWKNIRELSAYFNSVETPNIKDGNAFERWVQDQYQYINGKHIYQHDSKLGCVMIHIDSQNGMGSGYTENEFVMDLTERASLRHRGEYTSEQVFKTTMYGGFSSIGLKGDPRSECDSVGYKITPIILDYLNVNKKIVMLTNNPFKIRQMENFGYKIIRVKSIGAVNVAGVTEATQRGTEFCHLDIDGELITFKEDLDRIKEEINEIIESDVYGD